MIRILVHIGLPAMSFATAWMLVLTTHPVPVELIGASLILSTLFCVVSLIAYVVSRSGE